MAPGTQMAAGRPYSRATVGPWAMTAPVAAHLGEPIETRELARLAQPGQPAGPTEQENGEAPAYGPAAPGPLPQLPQGRFGLFAGARETTVGCLIRVGDLPQGGQGGVDRGGVLGPARHPDVDLGGRAVPVRPEDVCKVIFRPCDLPEREIHLDRDVVRHAAEHSRGQLAAVVGGRPAEAFDLLVQPEPGAVGTGQRAEHPAEGATGGRPGAAASPARPGRREPRVVEHVTHRGLGARAEVDGQQREQSAAPGRAR